MREARNAGILVTTARAHVVVHHDVRNIVVGPNDDPEAIGQRQATNFSGHLVGPRRVALRYSGDEELKFRQQAFAGKREKSKHKQHRHSGVELLAGLVNN